MEQGIKKGKDEQFFSDCYLSQTPVWIITKDDDWFGGYLNSKPTSLFCEILEWKENKPKRIIYSNIHIRKEFEGSYSKLPLPDYIKRENGKTV